MTKQRGSIVGSVLGVIILAAISFGYLFYQQKKTRPQPVPQEPQKIKVAATIFPLFDITQNIAGRQADVKLILPPGASPHTFEPTPSQIKNLQGVKVIFAVGHGLDNWAGGITKNVASAQIVLVDHNINLIKSSREDAGGVNPHYFLSVKNARIIAQNISLELGRLDPPNRSSYRENLENYLQSLQALDQNLFSVFRALPSRQIATFHNAWNYFARDYNLTVVATFEPSPGKEPTAQFIREFQEKVRRANIRVIFSEPQLPTDQLQVIAKDLGVEIKILDPLGGVQGRESFMELMEYNAKVITGSLH